MLVQDAGLLPCPVVDQQFLGTGRAGEAADRVAGQAQLLSDLDLAAAFGQQAVHVGVPGPGRRPGRLAGPWPGLRRAGARGGG
jgi:hypothetical protein